MSATGQCLGDVAAVANPAIGHNRYRIFQLAGRLARLEDRRHLGNAHARNDSGGTDRSRTDANFDSIRPGGHQIAVSPPRGHVATNHVDFPLLFYLFDGFDDVGRMSVSTVDDNHVHAAADEAFHPLVIMHTDSSASTQPPLLVFASLGKPLHHVDVFDRNKPRQFVIFVNQQKFLHLFSH